MPLSARMVLWLGAVLAQLYLAEGTRPGRHLFQQSATNIVTESPTTCDVFALTENMGKAEGIWNAVMAFGLVSLLVGLVCCCIRAIGLLGAGATAIAGVANLIIPAIASVNFSGVFDTHCPEIKKIAIFHEMAALGTPAGCYGCGKGMVTLGLAFFNLLVAVFLLQRHQKAKDAPEAPPTPEVPTPE
mmetsp:Transcript_11893/g.28364  ORF Transcript_11893/g.28364 Transcript_11893/m.28364 type:complete len:187 (+) Transcript_11893:67-627(+)